MEHQYPQLHKITSLLKFIFETDEYGIRGIKDSPAKFLACYFALKHTGHTRREVAKFFKINPNFMEKQVENLKIEFLVHPENHREIERIEQLYLEWEINNLMF